VWKKRFGEDVLLLGAKIASELVHGGQRNSRSVDAPFWFISAPWRPGIRQSTLTERLEFAELLHVDRDGFAAAVDEVFRDDAWREFR
jgi:hypothetical protein